MQTFSISKCSVLTILVSMDKIGKRTELQMRNRPVKVIDITSQKQNKTKQGKERLDTFMTLELVRYVGSETQRNISYSTLINNNPLLISTPLHHRVITSWIFPSPKTSVDKLCRYGQKLSQQFLLHLVSL